MELSPYVEELRGSLRSVAEAGGAEARSVADRLLAAVEASTRLVLLEALSAAAAEITGELAPASVDVRLRGLDPEFVVTSPAPASGEDHRPTAPPPLPEGDESVARTTLRLPEQLKARVEEAAAREGLSVNAWLVRAVTEALDATGSGRAGWGTAAGRRLTGWAH